MNRTLAVLFAVAILTGCAGRSGNLAKCKKAARQIADGTLAPNAQGVVVLPPGLASATVDGQAYVTTMPSGNQWILFRTWRGKGANLEGFLFTDGDAPPVGSEVAVVTLDISSVGPSEVMIDEALGQSWYSVSRSMD